MDESLTRLNKFLSESGFCSRRQADKLIEEKRVTVNGEQPELGTKVRATDRIAVDGKIILQKKTENIYLAFNKPVGIECTTNEKVRDNIITFINYPKRIFPIGRLDKDSEGLILLTDDGDIVNKILRASNFHEKEYLVTVNKTIAPGFLEKMSQGVPILDTVTRKCKVEKVNDLTFKIVLTQGINRQIRRMCEYFDYEVIKLRRIRIVNILLDVPIGKYRLLRKEEVEQLNR